MKLYISIITLAISVLLPVHTIYAQYSSATSAPTKISEVDSEEKPGRDTPPVETSTSEKIVKAIEVVGNKSIGVTTIISKIKTKVGQVYRQNIISDDLKRLYNTGYFADVGVDREDYRGGFKVIFYITEKPIVEEITFSRTRHFNARSILNKLKTQKGKFLNKKHLNDDVRTIKELYSKKGLTMVRVDVETSVDEDRNKATLHFVIKEGTRIKIKKLDVYGNKTYRAKKIIRIIKTRADSLFTSGYLQDEVLEEDMERIKAFYEQNGFIDVQTDYNVEHLGDGRLAVTINVDEGKQYFIETVNLSGNSVLSDNEIKKIMVEVKESNVFSRERLSVDISNIRSLYFDKGYIFASVREATSLNPQTGKVEVKLDINEGSEAYVNKVKIQGNTRTRDIVVRRELRLYPGDRFDGEKMRRSKERLRNLGYFEEINYDIEDTDVDNKKDLIVQVKEAKTGTLSFGGGFSTVDQVVGFVEIEQRNFDFANWPTFTGGGQQLVLRAESGSTRNNLRLSFTEPWILDYPISGGFDAYRTTRDRERDVGFAYDEQRTGGRLRLGKQFTEYVSGGVFYRREKVTIDNLVQNVSADLAAEEGDNTTSMVGFNVKRDTRDSIFSPTKGLVLTSDFDVAGGFLGGEKDFYRLQGGASYFVPLKFDSVVEFRLRTGFSNAFGDTDKVPIFERFFAGGARSIRGYDERKVGPIDSVTNDPIGGEALLVGNIEYIVPIIDFLKLATFFDIGNVWANAEDIGTGSYKAGFGMGLRVKTPIGPVNLDYGYPLDDEPGEEDRSGNFYFSVSRGF